MQSNKMIISTDHPFVNKLLDQQIPHFSVKILPFTACKQVARVTDIEYFPEICIYHSYLIPSLSTTKTTFQHCNYQQKRTSCIRSSLSKNTAPSHSHNYLQRPLLPNKHPSQSHSHNCHLVGNNIVPSNSSSLLLFLKHQLLVLMIDAIQRARASYHLEIGTPSP